MSYATDRWIAQNRKRLAQEEAYDRKMAEEDRAAYERWAEHESRRNALYDVPDRAKDAYLAMEDNFGPETVKDFMNAMLETDT